jgi:Cft2 family RNA processing exonuclease
LLYWNKGLFLRSPQLAIDLPRRQPCGFVSHAHKDHAAKHGWTLATEQTQLLLAARQLSGDRMTAIPFHQEFDFHGVKLTPLPAGHMLGAAMLKVTGEPLHGLSALYTGDVRLRDSQLLAGAKPEPADVLVMETTFGQPIYRFPNREKQADQLADVVRRILQRGDLPIIHAYEVGKSQEIIKMLTSRNVPVRAYPGVAKMCEAYRKLGVNPGKLLAWDDSHDEQPAAVLTPPHKSALPPGHLLQSGGRAIRRIKIAVTGWAAQPGYARANGYDYAFPISDHADYDELWQLIEMVQPKTILCTHGDDSFVQDLRKCGLNARRLEEGFSMSAKAS